MTIQDKLMEELSCAIKAVYGSVADEEFDLEKVSREDLEAIAKKVAFYLDL